MLNSDTDCSDDDPDFYDDDDDGGAKRRRSRPLMQESQDSSESSEDVDNPEDAPPRKKALKGSSGKRKAAAAEGYKESRKRSSSWAPAHSLPPPLENPAQYSEWQDDTKVVEPAKSSSNKTYYCCIRGCDSGEVSDKDGLWLFTMPEDEELMTLWDERLPIDYERNRPHSPRVCFRHFDKADFVRRQQRLLGLREDAIPLKLKHDNDKVPNEAEGNNKVEVKSEPEVRIKQEPPS
ncbi:hypothetical protein HPB50_017143 [Hyalomma asiaticum]|uniref:Uncharacterized protein n=1 Tax=Hyalomma asiaticum TaxID=266040 RepID=A0ACB7T7Q3_HYAAI|nr:hypothetical protein HPB50_017143 [Hyalomma asiaticum]